ncbi:hypothetical protein A9Q99_19700 [Gammaproteobacteria bacterium 45_16_T64]|nr:hypothetical protein A9Q99_19700 [Gammaproteobacteria bacterium 45_16_T64]
MTDLVGSVRQFVAPERVDLTFDRKASAVRSLDKGLVAGVGVVDITPRPGVPKGGYAAMSNFGNGFRTRLRVRSFYIYQEGGEPVVIVQADLHAGSSIIRDKVAERVAEKTNIESNNICMTCTHTHAGPGQLLDSDFYNAFASNKPGLDVQLYEFVVDKIVESVLAAYEDRKPAKLATGKIDVWHATRNRSLIPHLSNPGKVDKTNIYDAINPNLYMIRIDQKNADGVFYPRAAISSFSIHGTSVPVAEKSNNADVWAYISGGLQSKISQHYDAPWSAVHGAFQGTHGDIAPNIKEGQAGFVESRRLGLDIADKAWTLFQSLEGDLCDCVNLGSAIREVDFYNEAVKYPGSIASRPVVGTALTAGAFENETPFLYHAPLFKHGSSSARWLFTQGEHGHKRWVGSYLQLLVLPKKEFPHNRQLQVLTIGDFMMLALPFEVSVEAGRRLVDSVGRVLGAVNGDKKEVFVTSLANGYTGYAVTPEEYARQYYEGGHTIYGPKTTPFLADQFAKLTSDWLIQGDFADLPHHKALTFKVCRYFEKQAPDELLVASALGVPTYHAGEESCWRFSFFERPPKELDFSIPLVRLECRDEKGLWVPLLIDGEEVDDQGYDVGLYATDVVDNSGRVKYQAVWYNPRLATVGTESSIYRFVYSDQINSNEITSAEFLGATD